MVSYRSDDLHRRHPLRASVAEWVRAPGSAPAARCRRCADDDVRRLVRAAARRRPAPPPTCGDIVERAEGNAFFAEELVAAELGGERRLPENLADVLLVRLDRLDEDSRTAVRAAAVAGRRVSHEMLSAVLDLDGADARPGTAGRGRVERAGPAGRRTATPSGTPCSPRRSTTTCCRESGSGCTRRTPRAIAGPPRRRDRRASWPGTPGRP